MKKIISLLLILSLLLSFSACKKDKDNNGSTNGNGGSDVTDTGPAAPTIVVPEYKDYGRGSLNFNEVAYSRPDLEAVIAAFNSVTETVKANEIPLNDQIGAIRSLEAAYERTESMYTLAEIYLRKDMSAEFWQTEFAYVSTNYPAFSQAVEALLVACAASVHKSAFETDYFGYSLDEYLDGIDYTDALVALLEREAELEAEYTALSTANVRVSYTSVAGFTWEGTADEVYAMAEEKYGKDTQEYKNVALAITNLYNQRVTQLSAPIYTELIKIRRLIADELECDSYLELAYKNNGYDYSYAQMEDLLDSIGRYIAPVAESLNSRVFSTYFQKNNQPRLDEISLINTMYGVYSKGDPDHSDAYSYMLQHGLYDVSASKSNRYEGAFTAYIDSNNSPYVFMTTSGFLKDYLTLAHEFGHFYDGFVNNGETASLDLAEISSQGMEYLSLLRLKYKLKSTDYEYLEYRSMYDTLNTTLLEQSFYAEFEHLAYRLEYDEITDKKLKEIAAEAFKNVFGEDLTSSVNAYNYVLIPHTILYPCYVESYVVSAIPSLEIFFKESYRTGKTGAGLAIYKELVARDNSEVSLEDALSSVGLSSPFNQQTVKEIANSIHYQISGKDYYTDTDSSIDAA